LCACALLLPAGGAAEEPPKPETLKTSITVTENVSAESPANVSALDAADLDRIPGINLDDRLRSIPGFSLFRRSSSLVAHPTTQGISLRGIGSSGASRTLVLWDGVPANDPFGGWVYWTRFIPAQISEVEVSRGATTSLFGDRAMSGAIALFSREPRPFEAYGEYAIGNRNSNDASLGLSFIRGKTALSGAARAFTTNGYYIIPDELRGPVDREAAVRFVTGNVRADRYTSAGNFFLNLNLLAEDRQNGTALTRNSTSFGVLAAGYERAFARDAVSLRAFHMREGFHSSFSSVNANRTVERLTFLQTVPSQASGGSALWRRNASRYEFLAGADLYRSSGTSTDHLIPSGLRAGGGYQLQHGYFAQGSVTAGPARFSAGLRFSRPGGSRSFTSPSAGAVIGRGRLRLRVSGYRAFRAPTLNELYREFSAGNTVTRANPALRPETLSGFEAGADWAGENFKVRATAYRYSLGDLITNVTLSSSPSAIVRQRANAASAVSRGFEAEVERRYRYWTAEASYLFADSRYSTGLRVAQIPRHQGSAQLSYMREGAMISAILRSSDYQFDDDVNRFRLPGFAVLGVSATKRLAKSLFAQVSVENALARTYYTAFTPTPNTGNPRLWTAGLRWDGRIR
jgi:outer membrane receptor protein involved in Fe transport